MMILLLFLSLLLQSSFTERTSQALGSRCEGVEEVRVGEGESVDIHPLYTPHGYQPSLNCTWKVLFPPHCHNSLALRIRLRPTTNDALHVKDEESGARLLSASTDDIQEQRNIDGLPDKIIVFFTSEDKDVGWKGFWFGTLSANNCAQTPAGTSTKETGILAPVLDGLTDLLSGTERRAMKDEGQKISARSFWLDVSEVQGGEEKNISFSHPMNMFIVFDRSNERYMSNVKISTATQPGSSLTSLSQSNVVRGGETRAALSGSAHFTVRNENGASDALHTTFLYWVDERENNYVVYEATDEDVSIRSEKRVAVTVLSHSSQIGLTAVRLGKHGGLKITAGGLAETWMADHQLIRLTTYDTANISSYSIFDPIITIEPTSVEAFNFTLNSKLYLTQASQAPGAQGIIMSAGYPDFDVVQRPIHFQMKFTQQVHLELFIRSNTMGGSSLSVSTRGNHSNLEKSYSGEVVGEAVRGRANEFSVAFTPTVSHARPRDFLFVTFWTRSACALLSSFTSVLILTLVSFLHLRH